MGFESNRINDFTLFCSSNGKQCGKWENVKTIKADSDTQQF